MFEHSFLYSLLDGAGQRVHELPQADCSSSSVIEQQQSVPESGVESVLLGLHW